MKKDKIYRKEIEFQIDGSSTDIFESFDEEYLKNNFGFYKSEATGVKGFTGGSPPNPFRFEGEGLPTEKDSNSHHKGIQL